MFELYNGHPAVNNEGDSTHISTEELWDELLTKGMKIFGVSSDDAHHFAKIDTMYSNPGRGWVMVRAAQLTSEAITDAMKSGDFYSSNGVILGSCSVADETYQVAVDQQKTMNELASATLFGRRVSQKENGFFIEFIGPNGEILSAVNSTEADFPVTDAYAYIRPKVIYRRKHPQRGMEEFYAWGQPVFTDARKKQPSK